jgi:methylamine---glutamate N-methyltransferase subunit A
LCGVVGLLLRDPELETELGSMLVTMVAALGDRGPDSSGIAVYADDFGSHRQTSAETAPQVPLSGPNLRISLGSDEPVDWLALKQSVEEQFPPSAEFTCFPTGTLIVALDPDVDALRLFLETQWPSVRVIGTGRSVTVIKDTGRPEETCRRYGVGAWEGYLAIAHTRMATESAITVLHSHPFVPSNDLCVVHNGSFSNYSSVRRHLKDQGVRFDSDNDSEVAARFLARRLASGDDLAEATRWVMKEMDGFFTLVITTASAMSVVRDAFACKPAVVAETSRYVAMASEYRALAGLPGIKDADVFEPAPEEVFTWER